MKKYRFLVCLLTGAMLLCAPAVARQKSENGETEKHARHKKHKSQKGALLGEYAIMANVVDMSEQQKAKFKKNLAARKEALDEFNEQNAEKIKELRQAMKQAKSDEDKDKINELKAQMKELTAAWKQIHDKHDAEIMSLLTPAQRNRWEGFKVYRRLMRKYRKLDLSDDQQQQIRTICYEYGEKLAASPKEHKRIANEINDKALEVLTEDQKAKLKSRKSDKDEKGDKPKKGKRARKAKGKNKHQDADDADDDDE